MDSESSPLLHCAAARDAAGLEGSDSGNESRVDEWRCGTRRFLSSKWGHYTVIILVGLDVSSIFADFIIKLYICSAGDTASGSLSDALIALGIISLVFSCLFMVELSTSIWAYGFQSVLPSIA